MTNAAQTTGRSSSSAAAPVQVQRPAHVIVAAAAATPSSSSSSSQLSQSLQRSKLPSSAAIGTAQPGASAGPSASSSSTSRHQAGSIEPPLQRQRKQAAASTGPGAPSAAPSAPSAPATAPPAAPPVAAPPAGSSSLARSASQKKVRFSLAGNGTTAPSHDDSDTHNDSHDNGSDAGTDSRIPSDHSDANAVAAFVAAAVAAKLKNDAAMYNTIISLLTKRPADNGGLSPSQIRLYIRALTNNVSHLSTSFQTLILAVLSLDWLGQDASFVQTFCHFLENLVSAHSFYVPPIAKMLVQQLRQGPKQHLNLPQTTIFDRIHTALERTLRLVPTGPSFLIPVLTVNFPHKSEDLEAQVFYVKSLLRITSYAPILRNQILSIIVEGIVQIDVDIQIEIEELDDEQLEAIQDTVFSMDDLDIVNTETSADQTLADPASEDEEEEDGEEEDDEDEDDDDEDEEESDEDSDYGEFIPITSDIKGMVEKLDTLLTLVLQYISNLHANDERDAGTTAVAQIPSLFNAFMDIFDRTIIPTHRLRCTQFLIFYITSLHKSFSEDMIGLLLSRLFSVASPSVIRVSSASYLGSFIARSKYVELSSVRTCLHLLNQFTQSYLDANEASMGSSINVERFGILYSAVQAILYVFCFRWKQLMVVDDAPLTGQFPSELKGFQRVLLSRFAPLKVCSDSIVNEFAKIMFKLDVMYCYPLMAGSATPPNVHNNSTSSPAGTYAAVVAGRHSAMSSPISATQGNATAMHGILAGAGAAPDLIRSASQSSASSTHDVSYAVIERLDAFFPFDPLTLPRSRGFIQALYQEWEGGDEGEDEDEDEDEGNDTVAAINIRARASPASGSAFLSNSGSMRDRAFDSDDEDMLLGTPSDARSFDPMSTSYG